MLKVCTIARFDPTDEGAVKAIDTLRDTRRALTEQDVDCPEIFYVSIFLASLDPVSAIREQLNVLVSDQGAKV